MTSVVSFIWTDSSNLLFLDTRRRHRFLELHFWWPDASGDVGETVESYGCEDRRYRDERNNKNKSKVQLSTFVQLDLVTAPLRKEEKNLISPLKLLYSKPNHSCMLLYHWFRFQVQNLFFCCFFLLRSLFSRLCFCSYISDWSLNCSSALRSWVHVVIVSYFRFRVQNPFRPTRPSSNVSWTHKAVGRTQKAWMVGSAVSTVTKTFREAFRAHKTSSFATKTTPVLARSAPETDPPSYWVLRTFWNFRNPSESLLHSPPTFHCPSLFAGLLVCNESDSLLFSIESRPWSNSPMCCISCLLQYVPGVRGLRDPLFTPHSRPARNTLPVCFINYDLVPLRFTQQGSEDQKKC